MNASKLKALSTQFYLLKYIFWSWRDGLMAMNTWCLQRTRIWVPGSTGWLTTTCNWSFRESEFLFSLLWALGTHSSLLYTRRQNTQCPYNKTNNKKIQLQQTLICNCFWDLCGYEEIRNNIFTRRLYLSEVKTS